LSIGLFVGHTVYWGGADFVSSALANEEKKAELPPLIIDDDEPLLLLEETVEQDKSALEIKALVESQPCFVCHVNFQEESLAGGHAKAGISCVRCHGYSFAHRNDENNTTPPDTMFPAQNIDKACMECHIIHDTPAVKVIARWLKCCPEKTDPETIVCTDCHGQHRLKVRTVQWDKKTGKLLPMKPKSLQVDLY
jgi:hypothetical protein